MHTETGISWNTTRIGSELGALMHASFRVVQDPLDLFSNEHTISEQTAGSELMPFFDELFKLSRFPLNLANNEFS